MLILKLHTGFHIFFSHRNTKESPFSNHLEDTKLFRLIEQQLLDGEADINFENVWQEFRQADRLHRSTLSRDQVSSVLSDSWAIST